MSKDELLWKYAANMCTPQEAANLETMLSKDPALIAELQSVRDIQDTLSNMEPEQPSLRFTQNVMEALPEIYPSAASESLVNAFWKKLFWMAGVTFLALIIYTLGNAEPSQASPVTSYLETVTNLISNTAGQLPVATIQLTVLVVASIMAIIAMDKLFKNRSLYTI